jgi:AAA15 family ATPase/GTPase
MLIGFTVENYRSFFGEATLSMVATSDNEHRKFNVFETRHGDLLKNVLIYGANASGKSNLIEAMRFMKKMIVSTIDVQTEHIKTCQPFAFRDDAKMLPTKFEISFALDSSDSHSHSEVVYEYGFEILNEQIIREYLYKKAKRRTLVFERTAPDCGSIQLTADMADVEPLKKNVRGDVLFLSWAAFSNNTLATHIVKWVADRLIIFGLSGNAYKGWEGISDLAVAFVHKSDRNIVGMSWRLRGDLLSRHKVYSEGWEESQMVDVPFADYASEGTKRMFDLSFAFSGAEAGSNVIVIDEMDLHLHPALVRHLITLINSIEHNPNHVQLICTTHDVLLLDEDIRRDQVWFVDKDEHGASSLYALSDFKDVRKNSDILKRYLLGVYGAIPDLRGGLNG